MEVNRDYLLIVKNSYTGNEFEEVIINVKKLPFVVNLPLKSTGDIYKRARENARGKILYYLKHKEASPNRRRKYETISEMRKAF